MTADSTQNGTQNYSEQGGGDWVVNGTLEGTGRFDMSLASTVNLPAPGANNTDLGAVPNANTTPGIMGVHRLDIANATANTSIVLDKKERVIDVVVVKTNINGGAGDTVTVQNGVSAITNAISLNVSNKAVARAGTIDAAHHEIAAGGSLTVAANSVTDCTCTVYIHTLRVA